MRRDKPNGLPDRERWVPRSSRSEGGDAKDYCIPLSRRVSGTGARAYPRAGRAPRPLLSRTPPPRARFRRFESASVSFRAPRTPENGHRSSHPQDSPSAPAPHAPAAVAPQSGAAPPAAASVRHRTPRQPSRPDPASHPAAAVAPRSGTAPPAAAVVPRSGTAPRGSRGAPVRHRTPATAVAPAAPPAPSRALPRVVAHYGILIPQPVETRNNSVMMF